MKKFITSNIKESIITDGETTSGTSAGSDAVPSDDNLDKGKMSLVIPNKKEIDKIVQEEENPSLKKSSSKLPKKSSLKQSKFQELNKSLEKEKENGKSASIKNVKDLKRNNRQSMDKDRSNTELRKNFITERNKTIRNRQAKDETKKEPVNITIETQCTLEYEIKIKKQITKLINLDNGSSHAQDIIELNKEMRKFDVNNYKNKTDFDRFLIEFKKKERNYLEHKAKEKDSMDGKNPMQLINNIKSTSSLRQQSNTPTKMKIGGLNNTSVNQENGINNMNSLMRSNEAWNNNNNNMKS